MRRATAGPRPRRRACDRSTLARDDDVQAVDAAAESSSRRCRRRPRLLPRTRRRIGQRRRRPRRARRDRPPSGPRCRAIGGRAGEHDRGRERTRQTRPAARIQIDADPRSRPGADSTAHRRSTSGSIVGHRDIDADAHRPARCGPSGRDVIVTVARTTPPDVVTTTVAPAGARARPAATRRRREPRQRRVASGVDASQLVQRRRRWRRARSRAAARVRAVRRRTRR